MVEVTAALTAANVPIRRSVLATVDMGPTTISIIRAERLRRLESGRSAPRPRAHCQTTWSRTSVSIGRAGAIAVKALFRQASTPVMAGAVSATLTVAQPPGPVPSLFRGSAETGEKR